MTPEIKRRQDESLSDYHIRLGDNLDLYGLNWSTAASLLNAEAEEEYSESKWRKDYQAYMKWKDYIVTKYSDNEALQEIQDKTIEFQKQKYQFQDQKREYNKIVRMQARFDHLKEEIHKSILELREHKPLKFENRIFERSSDVRANVLWSDWHYGSDFSNSLNTYNPEVFRERLQVLIGEIIGNGKLYKVDTLTIGALGDFLSGGIHVSTRVQSSEDVIRQVKAVSEAISESLAELSRHFKNIRFINIIGNHARLMADKSQSLLNENLEKLIPWYLESRLNEFKNIDILTDTDGYFVDETFEPQHIYVHGDLDHVSSVAKSLPQMLGIVPKYIFGGHIHHDTVKEHGKTKVITNGSLMGVDDYSISKRLFAEPMQKMHIFDDKDRIKHTVDIYV